jgi:hypothetical protein
VFPSWFEAHIKPQVPSVSHNHHHHYHSISNVARVCLLGQLFSGSVNHINIIILYLKNVIQAYVEDIAGSVPEHQNKASHTNFLVSQCILYKSYVYTILTFIKYAIALCLKNNVHTSIKKYFIAKKC